MRMAAGWAMSERADDIAAARDFDWGRVYADQLPRVYNFFRFRFANRCDLEDLTARSVASRSDWKRPTPRRAQDGFGIRSFVNEHAAIASLHEPKRLWYGPLTDFDASPARIAQRRALDREQARPGERIVRERDRHAQH